MMKYGDTMRTPPLAYKMDNAVMLSTAHLTLKSPFQKLDHKIHLQKKMQLDEISRGIASALGTLQLLCPATTRSNPCRSLFARCAQRVLNDCSMSAREKNILNVRLMKIIALAHDILVALYFSGCHMLCSLRPAGFLHVVKSPNLPRSIAYFTL